MAVEEAEVVGHRVTCPEMSARAACNGAIGRPSARWLDIGRITLVVPYVGPPRTPLALQTCMVAVPLTRTRPTVLTVMMLSLDPNPISFNGRAETYVDIIVRGFYEIFHKSAN